MEAAGYEVKQGRGGFLSFRAPGQERFTRCRASTLGEGYGPEDIRAIIEGRAPLPSSRATEPVKQGRKLNLLIDIQTRLQGKGPAYERWAKVFNLKQMAAALAYLQDNGLTEYEQLEKKAEQATEHFHALAGKAKRWRPRLPPTRNSRGPRSIMPRPALCSRRTKRPGTAGNTLWSMRRKLRFTGRRGQP